jgi:hypothetical protein
MAALGLPDLLELAAGDLGRHRLERCRRLRVWLL